MIKREELDQLRCEITVIPTRHYNHAARALQIADDLVKERDNIISLAKRLLMHEIFMPPMNEREALAIIFSSLHGGSKGATPKPKSPYEEPPQ